MRVQRDLLVAVMALGLALIACKKLVGEKSEGAAADEKSSPASAESAGTPDSIGVPACDEYLTKYEKCIANKVPAAARETMKASLEQMRKSWKQAASTPAAKAGLEAGCKQALEGVKQATASYGCEW